MWRPSVTVRRGPSKLLRSRAVLPRRPRRRSPCDSTLRAAYRVMEKICRKTLMAGEMSVARR